MSLASLAPAASRRHLRLVIILLACCAVINSTQTVRAAPPSSEASRSPAPTADLGPLVYEGNEGPGVGKQIVFLAGDHEYRSEEMMPALARILAKRHGFRCTVLFTLDPKDGTLLPGSSHMPHSEVIDEADLLVFGLRFQNFPDEVMERIVQYVERGGPIIGTRTSTHAFKIPSDSRYADWDYQSKSESMPGGFGRTVLGETWAGHYGTNHVMSTRMELVAAAREHPVLRGVDQVWVESGGYWTEPVDDVTVLAMTQPLQGMQPDAPPAVDKKPCPGVWVRTYQAPSGAAARVFTTTAGASEDLQHEGFRRMMVNACFWAIGLEKTITPSLEIGFVGPYRPSPFAFDGHRPNVHPQDLAGWTAPIMPD